MIQNLFCQEFFFFEAYNGLLEKFGRGADVVQTTTLSDSETIQADLLATNININFSSLFHPYIPFFISATRHLSSSVPIFSFSNVFSCIFVIHIILIKSFSLFLSSNTLCYDNPRRKHIFNAEEVSR